jgi:hypothetical protein
MPLPFLLLTRVVGLHCWLASVEKVHMPREVKELSLVVLRTRQVALSDGFVRPLLQ